MERKDRWKVEGGVGREMGEGERCEVSDGSPLSKRHAGNGKGWPGKHRLRAVRRTRGTDMGLGRGGTSCGVPYRPDLIHGAAFRHGLVDEIAAARHCRDDLQEVVLAVDGGVHRGEKRRGRRAAGREGSEIEMRERTLTGQPLRAVESRSL